MNRGELRSGLTLAEENLCLAGRLGDPHILSHSHYFVAIAHGWSGEFAAARRHLEKALALYDPVRDRSKAARFGNDARVACYTFLGLVLWYQGFPDQGLRHSEEAIAAARAVLHPPSEARALGYAAQVHQLRGEAAPCMRRAEAAFALAAEQGLQYWAALAMVYSGWALVKDCKAEEGLARLRSGLDAYRATGAKIRMPEWVAVLAEACLETRRIEEGLLAVREALAELEQTEARCCEAELNRLEGELLLAAEDRNEALAEASFRRAIAIAHGQGAKSLELRAAMSLARLLARQGKRAEARALLAPIHSSFTEGLDTADLKEAKGLLNELR
jgi:predicted ATPase